MSTEHTWRWDSAPEPEASPPVAAAPPAAPRPVPPPQIFATRTRVGTRLHGHIELEALLGEDPFGERYSARSEALPGLALEVRLLAPSLLADPERVRALRRDLEITGHLRSAEIAGVVAFDLEGSPGWIASTALPEATSLEALLGGRALPPRAAFLLASRLASALAPLHDLGVLHRNLTPGCVRLAGVRRATLERDPDAVARAPFLIVDWALHQLVAARAPLASFHRCPEGFYGYAPYLPPEVGRNAPMTPQSDIYAVGILLYEALTGKPPFTSEDFGRTLRRHVYETPLRPELARRGLQLTPDESSLIQLTLARSPEARFASLDALAGALEAAGYGQQRQAPTEEAAEEAPEAPQAPLRPRTGTLPLFTRAVEATPAPPELVVRRLSAPQAPLHRIVLEAPPSAEGRRLHLGLEVSDAAELLDVEVQGDATWEPQGELLVLAPGGTAELAFRLAGASDDATLAVLDIGGELGGGRLQVEGMFHVKRP